MSRKLAAGLVLLGALVTGAVLGLLLVAPGGAGPTAVTTSASTPPVSPSSTADDADVAAVAVLAKDIVDAITQHDSAAFGKLTCRPQTTEALAKLQKTWDTAGPVTATLPRPPEVEGESATAVVHVEGAGGKKDTPFPLHKEAGRWCVPG